MTTQHLRIGDRVGLVAVSTWKRGRGLVFSATVEIKDRDGRIEVKTATGFRYRFLADGSPVGEACRYRLTPWCEAIEVAEAMRRQVASSEYDERGHFVGSRGRPVTYRVCG